MTRHPQPNNAVNRSGRRREFPNQGLLAAARLRPSLGGIVECHFAIDIYAPRGLVGIEATLRDGGALPLYSWESGYNGKVILRASQDDRLEWNMDSSDDDNLFASGDIFEAVEVAEGKLRWLSSCLAAAGYSHSILLDDPEGNLHAKIEHAWPPGDAA